MNFVDFLDITFALVILCVVFLLATLGDSPEEQAGEHISHVRSERSNFNAIQDFRSGHSVLKRQDPRYLKEIILVDDYSDKEHLKDKFDEYVKQFNGIVKLIRNEEREGAADVHFRGIFKWGLLYKETEITKEENDGRKHNSQPFRSPKHTGGLFAIDKKWFAELGYYDPGLQIWSGEQYELSFKIWMCGGGILFVPCSNVGHVYRNLMPYGFGKLTGKPVIANTGYVRWYDMERLPKAMHLKVAFNKATEAASLQHLQMAKMVQQ
uniref:Glycosyltransferase 2-like domain-containing protein n=1 Tax=Panagrolaimus davidi TaxID=227884 RepID=A0A914P4X8_9BILA